MLIWIASSALSFALVHEPTQDPAVTELNSLAAKVAQLENYSFTSKSETEGGGGGRAGRGGGAGPMEIVGAWTKSLPMKLELDNVVAYKEPGQFVTKNEEGRWQVMESSGRGGRGGRGRGEGGGERRPPRERGGDAGGPPPREGGGEGRRPPGEGGDERSGRRGGFGGPGGVFRLSATNAPHALFADFETKVADVRRAETTVATAAGDSTVAKIVYSGKLTEKGAQSLGSGRGGFGSRGGPEMDVSGSFEIEVAGDAIHAVKFVVTRSGSFGERSFEVTTTQTITFDKIGKTEYEVPEEALALFEV